MYSFTNLDCMANLNTSFPVILLTAPKDILCSITGNLLGDGSLRPGSRTKNGIIRGNARYQMTMRASSKDYLDYLLKDIQSHQNKQILMYCTGGIRCEKAYFYIDEKYRKNIKLVIFKIKFNS